MEKINTTCENCGAAMTLSNDCKELVCEYCGTRVILEEEKEDDAWRAGYDFEMGRQHARADAVMMAQGEQKKKRRTWLWVLGWLFCPCIPLTVLIARSKKLSKAAKAVFLCIIWGAFALFTAVGLFTQEELPLPPENAAVVSHGEYASEGEEDEGFVSSIINGREFIPFGTLKSGTSASEVVSGCIGVDGDDENVRYYSLKGTKDFIGQYNTEGIMEIFFVLRAVDSLEKGGDVPDFILPDLY